MNNYVELMQKLEDLLLYTNKNFQSVTLEDEIVTVTCRNGYQYRINVSGNSEKAIVHEVITKIIYK